MVADYFSMVEEFDGAWLFIVGSINVLCKSWVAVSNQDWLRGQVGEESEC